MTRPSSEDAFSLVASIGAQGCTTTITAGGRHTILADEPPETGCADAGPNPYDLLLAALAACKLITLRMYADRKGWPLEGVHARLRQERVHARDCAECENTDGFIQTIDVVLALVGELSAEQRHRLLEIADRCPVHKTLRGEIVIHSRLDSDAGA